MRKFFMALAAAAVALATPASGSAQELSAVCDHMQQADAGDWAEYATEGPQGSGTIRYALLEEAAASDPGQWLEMSGSFNGQTSTVQILIEEYPHAPEDVSAVVIKRGDQPAQRLPDSMLGQVSGQMSTPIGNIAEICDQSNVMGTEAVDVPAGSFQTVRIQPPTSGTQADTLQADVWLSTDAVFGLVKTESSLGSMTLTGMGSDATSSITEAPTEMQPAMPGGGTP